MSGIDNVYFTIKRERHSYYQALLSLGDRRVAPAIVAAERNGGQWRAAVAETGVDADAFIFRDRSEDALLPWDIIDGGMKQAFFRNEFEKSTRAEWTLPPKRARENRSSSRRCSAGGFPGAAKASTGRYAVWAVSLGRVSAEAAGCRRIPGRLLRLVLGERLQDQRAQRLLRGRVDDRPQQREAAALAVDREAAGRERDVAPAAAAARLPDREADQLQAVEDALVEEDLRIGDLADGRGRITRKNADHHAVTCLSRVTSAAAVPQPRAARKLVAGRVGCRDRVGTRTGRRRRRATTAVASAGLPRCYSAISITCAIASSAVCVMVIRAFVAPSRSK